MCSWQNVTNQPLFSGRARTCDSVVRIANTAVTTGNNVPVYLSGDVAALKSEFNPTKKTIWSDVAGIKLDEAYYERPAIKCKWMTGQENAMSMTPTDILRPGASLKGFSVVNAPAAAPAVASSAAAPAPTS